MSIIYDALKKLQKEKTPSSINRPSRYRRFYIYIPILLIGFFLPYFIFEITFNNKFFTKSKEKSQELTSISEQKITLEPDIEPETPKLEGIFYDSNEPYALINNHILKKKDCFKDWCIKEIFPDKVEIQFQEKILELRLKD